MQIEESAGTPNKFIVLRQEVLYDDNLTMAEKFVYARMCQFDEYFESCQEAGTILGLSAETVKKAKQKLVKLGYASELVNTGRGKVYKVYDIDEQKRINRRVKSTRQTGKNESVRRVKSTRRVIELNKKENNNGTIVPLGASAEHGNPDINQMFESWQEIFGFEQKQSAENRRACYNLIRKKGVGKDNLVQLIRLLAEAQRDRYAPREVRAIVGFASLQSNLPHLMMWGRRKYSQAQGQKGIEI
jgi:hypothetical protein